jgi:CHAT domain-containing protein
LPQLLQRQVLVSEVDSPREFVAFRAAPDTVPQKPQVLLAGGIDFTGRNLNPLGATLNEVKEIAYEAKEMGIDSILLTAKEATKERVRNALPTVSYAHFATHGFSHHGNDSSSGQEMRAVTLPLQTSKGNTEGLITARNPLTDSGIFLSLPNSEKADPNDTGDGAVTGEEMIGMDLRKCDLVTLSACDTGLGKEFTGQGVLGLRAAIMAAGAKSLLMPLWSVPDASTRELMNRFYHYVWAEHKGKSEALSLAQKDVQSHEKWKAPKYWAAWVLAGKGW